MKLYNKKIFWYYESVLRASKKLANEGISNKRKLIGGPLD